jgi:hypothetical protein
VAKLTKKQEHEFANKEKSRALQQEIIHLSRTTPPGIQLWPAHKVLEFKSALSQALKFANSVHPNVDDLVSARSKLDKYFREIVKITPSAG